MAAAPYLYTLTGNLLAETTATYDAVAWHETQRAVEESFQVGGKGINVARMAERLGMASRAVCFPGGHTGARCLAWLKARHFDVAAFPQVAETRAGWVVRAGDTETTFLGHDRPLEEEPWQQALEFLSQNLRRGDTFAVCGSLPGWRSSLAEPLRNLINRIEGDVFIALDTYGFPLLDLLRCPISLVKINRQEFAALLPAGEHGVELEADLLHVARAHPNVKRWVITAGDGPVVSLDENGRLACIDPPRVEVVSAVGCGDVLLAGLLQALVTGGRTLEEAVKQALPLAAANAASPGIADFDPGALRKP